MIKNNYLPKLTQLQGAKLYAELSKEVTKAGILERDYSFYLILTTVVLTGFFTSLLFLFKANSLFGLIFWSIPFSFFWVQAAGLMHDAGHMAIFKSVKNNDLAGRLLGGLTNSGYSSWKQRHNEHHANPNDEDEDSDVIDFPFISFSQQRVRKSKGIFRIIIKHQVFVYFLIQPMFSLSMRIAFIVNYLQKNGVKNLLEIVVFTVGLFMWFILPFILFDWPKALFFIIVSGLLTGFYMANIFAPNHKGMPLVKKSQKLSFFEAQIATSRDIKANPLIDFVYLGLNYQIEHHLFPNCPRNKLKLLTPYVKKACQKSGIKFNEVNVVESNRIILGELKRLSLSV